MEGSGNVNLRITSFADNSERQSFVSCIVHGERVNRRNVTKMQAGRRGEFRTRSSASVEDFEQFLRSLKPIRVLWADGLWLDHCRAMTELSYRTPPDSVADRIYDPCSFTLTRGREDGRGHEISNTYTSVNVLNADVVEVESKLAAGARGALAALSNVSIKFDMHSKFELDNGRGRAILLHLNLKLKVDFVDANNAQ
ncbi:hypothetical protein EVAR_40164_1 [Eumeta japonica]|uniref:Uncharacterized protein n=1 Tax=Eumeta variegata TaxID=151549 RepID=A0A4C1YH67_EUMVA|nr:hypothetical protein EVAR_40164_1 [Eumeta japonica]